MLKLKLQYFGHLIWRTDSFEKTLVLEKIEGGGWGDDRGWDGLMASPTGLTWVWVGSWNWWWTGKSGVLQSMGWQRVRHDWVTEWNWTELIYLITGYLNWLTSFIQFLLTQPQPLVITNFVSFGMNLLVSLWNIITLYQFTLYRIWLNIGIHFKIITILNLVRICPILKYIVIDFTPILYTLHFTPTTLSFCVCFCNW